MRGFHQLVMLGALLVTLLLVIDTIDAGRKEGKKKELETGKQYDEEGPKLTSESKRTDSIKHDKVKKTGSQRTENYEEENEYMGKDPRFETKKHNLKKNINFASKDKKYTENENTKTTRHSQKLKKSKVFHGKPEETFHSGKSKIKKIKPQYVRSENIDKIVKTVKKTTQKKLIEENENIEKVLSEELNRLKNEETISVEESIGGNKKKRKYKLVEVVLEDDGEEELQDGNETTTDFGSEDREFINIESEEITEKSRSIQNPKSLKYKTSSTRLSADEVEQNNESPNEDNYFSNTEETAQSDLNEVSSEIDSFSARYTDPASESCQRLPEDPHRQGPRKLTLYVVEEEIDGQVRKRVVSEEDGVTMCEVAELLKESYNTAIPEE